MSIFQFREFSIRQERSAMKIGTDSLLLGCFADPAGAGHVLDIGTGTGILALMMAQRSAATIDAVEIDAAAAEEAAANFSCSPWSNRVHLHHMAFQQFAFSRVAHYDLIITNPPYYHHRNNIGIEDQQRAVARHDQSLSFVELCANAYNCLSETGTCCMVLPVNEAMEMRRIASTHRFYVKKEIMIRPRSSKPVNREVLFFTKQHVETETVQFTIYEENGEHTDLYFQLTKDFLLWKNR